MANDITCAKKVADRFDLSWREASYLHAADPIAAFQQARRSLNMNSAQTELVSKQINLLREFKEAHIRLEREELQSKIAELMERAKKPDEEGGLASFIDNSPEGGGKRLVPNAGRALAYQYNQQIYAEIAGTRKRFIEVANRVGVSPKAFADAAKMMGEDNPAFQKLLDDLSGKEKFSPKTPAEEAAWMFTRLFREINSHALRAGHALFTSPEGTPRTFRPAIWNREKVAEMSSAEFYDVMEDAGMLPNSVSGAAVVDGVTEGVGTRIATNLRLTIASRQGSDALPLDYVPMTAVGHQKLTEAGLLRAPSGDELMQNFASVINQAAHHMGVHSVLGHGRLSVIKPVNIIRPVDESINDLIELADGQNQLTASLELLKPFNVQRFSAQGRAQFVQSIEKRPKRADLLLDPSGQQMIDELKDIAKSDRNATLATGISRVVVNVSLKSTGPKYILTDGTSPLLAKTMLGGDMSAAEQFVPMVQSVLNAMSFLFQGTRINKEAMLNLGLAAESTVRSWNLVNTRMDIENDILIGDTANRISEKVRYGTLRTQIEDGSEAGARNAVVSSILAHAHRSYNDIMEAKDVASINFRKRFLQGDIVDTPVVGQFVEQFAPTHKNMGVTRELWEALGEVKKRQSESGDGFEWLAETNPRLYNKLIGYIELHTAFFARSPLGVQTQLWQALKLRKGSMGTAIANMVVPFIGFRARMHRATWSIKSQWKSMTKDERATAGKALIYMRSNQILQTWALQASALGLFLYWKGDEDIIDPDGWANLLDMPLSQALSDKRTALLIQGLVLSDGISGIGDILDSAYRSGTSWQSSIGEELLTNLAPGVDLLTGTLAPIPTEAAKWAIGEDSNMPAALQRVFVPDLLKGAALMAAGRPDEDEGGLHRILVPPARD